MLLSAAGTGTLGTYQTLLEGQALRIWYLDPTLHTALPERRHATSASELLFRVPATLDVVEIDPNTSRFRSTGRSVEGAEIVGALRSYARGAAASGETARALRILMGLSNADRGPMRSFDLRIAAMVLRASGRLDDAEQIVERAPPLERFEALDMVGNQLAEPTGRADLDSCAFWAFGVSPDDPEALRYIIGQFRIGGYTRPALDLALRLQKLAPADSTNTALVQALERGRW